MTITKTKDYLVFKIPIKAIKIGAARPKIFSRGEKAIAEGLEAIKNGKFSGSFSNAKEAVAFLRGL